LGAAIISYLALIWYDKPVRRWLGELGAPEYPAALISKSPVTRR
jgi:hypothetical protein